MSAVVDPQEATRRARAAWAYAGISQPDLAGRAGIKPPRLRAILAPTNTSKIYLDELHAIARACDVPIRFMESGFEVVGASGAASRPTGASDLERRLSALEAVVPTVTQQLERLTRSLTVSGEPTFEEALERLNHAADVIQRLEKRLGENIGRRDTRYRAARGRSQGPPKAAA